ncbi:MAG TPA: TIGR04086 family membrane protein [Acidimicrobiales bacterium]
MATRAEIETRQDRRALVEDAGFGRLSFVSVVAGVLCAYGLFAVLLGLGAGVVEAINADIDLASEWDDLGVAGGLAVAGLLFLSYLFGGYVAGRMARRSGTLHGVAVFALGVLLVAAAAALARALGGDDVAASNLRDLGVPTTADEWGNIATVAGLASLAGMLLGGLLGGALGERWHAKLLTRALDPRVGAEAEALRESERRAAEAERRSVDADNRRTGAFERVRNVTPRRTRRVDGDAPTQAIDMRDDDHDWDGVHRDPDATLGDDRRDTGIRRFRGRGADLGTTEGLEPVTGRRTGPSDGRTG